MNCRVGWHPIIRAARIALLAGLAAVVGTCATISGTLATTAAKPIRAAITLHDLSTSRTVGQTSFDHQYASKSDGSFILTGVAAGKYEICVEAPPDNVLDPCVWSPPRPTITVAAGDAVTGLKVTVQTGSAVQIRVNDPQALVAGSKASAAGNALSLMVITRGNRYVNFRLLGSDAAGSNHYLVVPFNEPMMLVTASTQLALSDANGKAIPSGSQKVPILVPAGGSLPPVTVNVGKQ